MSVTLRQGDCRDVIKTLADCSIDSCVTDPPYSLVSIQKRFGKPGSAPVAVSEFYKENGESKGSSPYVRASTGFMGQQWDTGEVVHNPEWWAEVYRVLKPGSHLVAFAGTRTYHRMVCAIEDAGFEIRDTIAWLYGTGFPKSHNVGKGIDKAARGVPHGGADPTSPNHGKFKGGCSEDNKTGQGFGAGPGQFMREAGNAEHRDLVDEAAVWEGFGTALKPAFEPIVLARKPLIGTVVANIREFGTGAINIDACRVGGEPSPSSVRRLGKAPSSCKPGEYGDGHAIQNHITPERWLQERPAEQLGRWPANVCHDGSDEVIDAFPQSKGQQGDLKETGRARPTKTCFGDTPPPHAHKARRDGEPSADRRYTDAGSTNFAALPGQRRNDAGSAARFFFSAKASKLDRWGTKHPTVKPVALMRWLVRLITPPGGIVLDPFAGSGTTGIAAAAEGFDCILIEREEQYAADIRERLAHFATWRHRHSGQGRHD